MRYLLLIFSILNFYSFLQAIDAQHANLVFSHVIFRHGDRTPCKTYPNDPWKDSWPEGYGQLTKLGMQQEYNLGKYFRKRYNALLPMGVYPNKLVHVQSTDRDRTLMSAAAVLAGIFPPTADQVWNENINWQPIPIHTIPPKMDHVLLSHRMCDRYNLLRKEHFNRPEYKAEREKYRWLYQYVADKSGYSIDDDFVYYVYDNLRIQQLYNKTIPEWAVNIYDDIEKLSRFEDFNEVGTREMTRLKSGFLLGEIIERFNSKINGTLKPNRSLWLYSSHDTTLWKLLNVLGLLDSQTEFPQYSASILIELYQYKKQYFVQLFYKNSDNEDIPPLDIPGCGTLCPMDKFHEIYKPFIPVNDFETECKVD